MADEFPPFRYITPIDPNIGRRVDVYFTLRALLGRGGMGAAYLAEHEARSAIRCVVKLVLADFAKHPAAITRYRMETEAVSVLSHDNIVKLHNFGVLDDGQLFMRFEYIEGTPLNRHIDEHGGRLPLRDAAYLIFQLCDALDYAHGRQVIHRDIKPDNLMVELAPAGSHLTLRIKILDFGIAKVATTTMEHTGSGIAMGTPRYASPEQVTNAAGVTGKADVFSLATVLYHAVTGTLPWGTPESDIAIYHKQRTEPPITPPEGLMPSAVTQVVFRALSLNPDDRPTMREFAMLLAAAIPADDHLPSGTDILREVKRSWVTSSPPHIPTLPRPVVSPEPAVAHDLSSESPAVSQRASSAAADTSPEPASPQNASVGAPLAPYPEPDLTTTARGGPRALAARVAGRATSRPAPGAGVLAVRQEASTPIIAALPTGLAAALPTGLVSQRFAAEEPSGGTREPSLAIASEIEMPAGTPGPRPYAHAELPAVLVSNTQLSAPAGKGAPSPPPAEPAPMLMLPATVRGTRPRNLVTIGAVACVLAAAGIFGVARLAAKSDGGATAGAPRVTEGRSGSAPAAGSNQVELGDGTSVTSAPASMATAAPADLGNHGRSATADGSTSAVQTPPSTDDRPAAGSAARDTDTTESAGRNARSAVPSGPGAASTSRVASAVSRPAGPQPVKAAPKQAAPSPPHAGGAAKTGALRVFVTPWALAWLDGKPLEQTPCMVDDVPIGRHRLQLKNSVAGKDETMTITVEPGHTTTIERTW